MQPHRQAHTPQCRVEKVRSLAQLRQLQYALDAHRHELVELATVSGFVSRWTFDPCGVWLG
jgi:hypothetical protein